MYYIPWKIVMPRCVAQTVAWVSSIYMENPPLGSELITTATLLLADVKTVWLFYWSMMSNQYDLSHGNNNMELSFPAKSNTDGGSNPPQNLFTMHCSAFSTIPRYMENRIGHIRNWHMAWIWPGPAWKLSYIVESETFPVASHLCSFLPVCCFAALPNNYRPCITHALLLLHLIHGPQLVDREVPYCTVHKLVESSAHPHTGRKRHRWHSTWKAAWVTPPQGGEDWNLTESIWASQNEMNTLRNWPILNVWKGLHFLHVMVVASFGYQTGLQT